MKPEEIFEKLLGIPGWFGLEDIESFSKIKLPKKPTILEIGTGDGRSTRTIRYLWPDANFTSCDPEKRITDEVIKEFKVNYFNVKGQDLEWDKPIDFLFIDDSHIYEDTFANFNKYKPFIKKGGYIVFHDYLMTDVSRVISEQECKVIKTGDYSQAIWINK